MNYIEEQSQLLLSSKMIKTVLCTKLIIRFCV